MKRNTGADAHLIYVLDNDAAALAALEALLSAASYRVECFTTAKALLAQQRQQQPACVVTEWDLPDMTGRELLGAITARPPSPAIIILTARSELSAAVKALRNGASDFVGKPYIDRTLINRIKQTIADRARS